jgi:hypothetical protein
VDEDETGATDPINLAKQGLAEISTFLGEKITMASCMGIIHEGTTSNEWKKKVSGLIGLGHIAESCKESMEKSMEEVIKKACLGMTDEHPRVRYAALTCLGLLLTELCPTAQVKYHTELMPMLLKMMESEVSLKMRTHAVSCTINFVSGLTDEDEDEREEIKKESSVLSKYSDALLNGMTGLMDVAVTQQYEPLLLESLNLVAVIATLIEKEFAVYYQKFMPVLKTLMSQLPAQTQQQKDIRAKLIKCMGTMVEAVSEEKETFVDDVKAFTQDLAVLLSSGLEEDDP